MTGIFILLALVIGVVAAAWAFVAARRSRRSTGSVHADRTPPSPPLR